jgi:hypothetical protein
MGGQEKRMVAVGVSLLSLTCNGPVEGGDARLVVTLFVQGARCTFYRTCFMTPASRHPCNDTRGEAILSKEGSMSILVELQVVRGWLGLKLPGTPFLLIYV